MDTVDGYIRVSRIGGRSGDGYISPDVQRQRIEEYAQLLGVEVAAWHDDQDYSGGNTERPGFQEVMRRIKAGETGGVIVAHTDRFSRSVADGSAAVKDILGSGGLFASAMERMDPRTPAGMYMLNNFFNQGEYEREVKKAGWAVSKERAVERGAHIGRTPFAYARVNGVLHPNENAPAVEAIYERRLAGHSYSDLARLLDELAPKPQPWQATEVKRVLSNPVYVGRIKYKGAVHDLANDEAHDAIVPQALFDAVQRTLIPGKRLRADAPFLLSGLVRCAACRYSMGGASHAGQTRDIRIYRCTGRARCESPSVITATVLEDFIVAQWRAQIGYLGATRERSAPERAAIADKLAATRDEINVHLEDLELKRRLKDRWRSHLDVLLDEEQRLVALEEEAEHAAGFAALGEIDGRDQGLLRAALSGTIRNVFVRRAQRGAPVSDRVRILWANQPEIAVPRPGVPGPFGPIDWEDLDDLSGVLTPQVVRDAADTQVS